ncbi:hypothetical protein GQX74_011806 [Glossina fuscipes]|nr:hypothetical protein GQX74_011806 [Glossina fuscipes]
METSEITDRLLPKFGIGIKGKKVMVMCLFTGTSRYKSLTTYSTSTTTTIIANVYNTDTTTVSPTNLLPYFDFDVPRNITVTVGQTGFLHCRVERLGDKDIKQRSNLAAVFYYKDNL